jgi:hypothetical protein
MFEVEAGTERRCVHIVVSAWSTYPYGGFELNWFKMIWACNSLCNVS